MKDSLRAYYTESDDITSFMINRLNLDESDIVLEPSAGEGCFIDAILKKCNVARIDALDIDDKAVKVLKRKYKNYTQVNVRKTDSLFDSELDNLAEANTEIILNANVFDGEQLSMITNPNGLYSKVVGNPPYGAWQEYSKRNLLKKKYPGQYVKETYSLFLLRCLSVLKTSGRLSFIIPDTFLYVNMHTKLREILLSQTKILDILIFPSNFFPGISFGYSNLSIITLEKADYYTALNNEFVIYKGFESPEQFETLSESDASVDIERFVFRQAEVMKAPKHRFILGSHKNSKLLLESNACIGDYADVVTGFYSGDNKRFMKVKSKETRGGKNYEVVNPQLIFECKSIEGIPEIDEGYVKYIKGAGKKKYIRDDTEWYVRWDADTVKYYIKDRKARFQNSEYYFKKGIAIPMVKSSNIRATIIEGALFDQSIVGVFPKDPALYKYFLAFLNSNVFNELIHIINPTANNSSNYVKQIPFIYPSEETLRTVNNSVDTIIDSICKGYEDIVDKQQIILDDLFDTVYNTK